MDGACYLFGVVFSFKTLAPTLWRPLTTTSGCGTDTASVAQCVFPQKLATLILFTQCCA